MLKSPDSDAQPSPTLDLDALMQRLRAEVNARKSQHPATPASAPENSKAAAAARGCSVDTLLPLPDAEFVRAAYAAVFAREATETEFAKGRDRLLTGEISRTHLLRELLKSDEARLRGARIDGLGRREILDAVRYSLPAKWAMNAAHTVRTIYLLPRRIGQFLKRVDGIERTAGETALRVNQLQGELRVAIATHWREIAGYKFGMEKLIANGQPDAQAGSASADGRAEERARLLDALYLTFEDRFRGTRKDIKNRQVVYLDRIKACAKDSGGAAVVDIGCGRGEWLELLREAGITAYGFELNRIALEENKARGLDVREGDALKSIAAMEDESVSAITGFHIIEHLPFEALVSLIDQSLRVLRPGGMLVFETPNPANLLVAAERFYLDPTHRNPLPSELISYLIKSRGFGNVEILALHPSTWPSRRAYNDPMLALLQDKLFGAEDYGVIGWKTR